MASSNDASSNINSLIQRWYSAPDPEKGATTEEREKLYHETENIADQIDQASADNDEISALCTTLLKTFNTQIKGKGNLVGKWISEHSFPKVTASKAHEDNTMEENFEGALFHLPIFEKKEHLTET